MSWWPNPQRSIDRQSPEYSNPFCDAPFSEQDTAPTSVRGCFILCRSDMVLDAPFEEKLEVMAAQTSALVPPVVPQVHKHL